MDATVVVSTLRIFSYDTTANMQCYFIVPLIVIGWIICIFVFIKPSFVPDDHSAIIQSNIANNASARDDNIIVKKERGENFQKIKNYHVPKFMLELYEENKSKGWNFTKPDIVRSLIPKHATSINGNEVVEALADNNHLLVFHLPNSEEEEQFVSAELKILTLVQVDSKIATGIERQLKISVYDDAAKTLYHLEEIHVYHLNNTWLSFNVTKPVVKILQKNNVEKYLKIIVSINSFLPYYQESEDSFQLSLMPVSQNFEHDYPILLLSYTSSQKAPAQAVKRSKRSLEEDYEEETNNVWDDEPNKKIQMKKLKRLKNTCRKRPLYINFAEIDYDLWIVQPPGYEAYQCQGKCFYPVAEHLSPTKHAIVQALLHSLSPAKASRSCCVPTVLDSISILYVDSTGVLTYRYAYKDMVVVECGCR